MSWLGDALSVVGRIVRLDGEVSRLANDVDELRAESRQHDRRLVRLETLAGYSDASLWSPPRLPR
jgi:hypothetical protein